MAPQPKDVDGLTDLRCGKGASPLQQGRGGLATPVSPKSFNEIFSQMSNLQSRGASRDCIFWYNMGMEKFFNIAVTFSPAECIYTFERNDK